MGIAAKVRIGTGSVVLKQIWRFFTAVVVSNNKCRIYNNGQHILVLIAKIDKTYSKSFPPCLLLMNDEKSIFVDRPLQSFF